MRRVSTADKCEDWLLTYLGEHGPSNRGDVVAAGKDAGFTRDTIYRTRKALQAMNGNTEKNFRAPGNRWRLLDEDSDEDEAVEE
jgi:hypothetical protein